MTHHATADLASDYRSRHRTIEATNLQTRDLFGRSRFLLLAAIIVLGAGVGSLFLGESSSIGIDATITAATEPAADRIP